MSKQKLELTWIGKENRPRLEPRILIEDPTKSYHAKYRVKNLTTEDTESTEKKRENNIPSQFSSVSSVNSVVKKPGDLFENKLIFGDNFCDMKAQEACLLIALSTRSVP